ncbi:MAG: TraV family lipoprotein [Gallionella sp.]
MMRAYSVILVMCVALTGCAGFDSESKFKCKAPDGIGCSSLSGTYANAIADNLPGSPKRKSSNKGKGAETEQAIAGLAPETGQPVLSAPVMLRVWIAPWEDGRKVLHDQAYLYAVVDPRHWQIAHNKNRIMKEYRVLSPSVRKPDVSPAASSPIEFKPSGADAQSQSGAN